jgi:hypothetical protein
MIHKNFHLNGPNENEAVVTSSRPAAKKLPILHTTSNKPLAPNMIVCRTERSKYVLALLCRSKRRSPPLFGIAPLGAA